MLTVSLLCESRPGERHVLLLPDEAAKLSGLCRFQVEAGAGTGLGVSDSAYQHADALVVDGTPAWRGDLMAATGEIAGQMAVIYAAYPTCNRS